MTTMGIIGAGEVGSQIARAAIANGLRQEQLPTSKVVKAFTHIQAPALIRLARNAGDPQRIALAVSSDDAEAVELVRLLQDQFGYDTVDHSPLSESWRTGPGTPVWNRSLRGGQDRDALRRNLALATRPRSRS